MFWMSVNGELKTLGSNSWVKTGGATVNASGAYDAVCNKLGLKKSANGFSTSYERCFL